LEAASSTHTGEVIGIELVFDIGQATKSRPNSSEIFTKGGNSVNEDRSIEH